VPPISQALTPRPYLPGSISRACPHKRFLTVTFAITKPQGRRSVA
jgi:hypothetical protein